MEWLLHVECKMCVNWIWGNSWASLSAINMEKVSLPPLIPGGAAALSVTEYEFTLYWGVGGLALTLEVIQVWFFFFFSFPVLFFFSLSFSAKYNWIKQFRVLSAA